MKFLKILFILLFWHFAAMTQSDSTYFVVIGTFRMPDNAARFSTEASQNGFVAKYAICPALGLYYVYVLETNDHLKAHLLSVKIKEETNFKNTWIYTGKLGIGNNTMTASDVRAARVKETEIKLAHIPLYKPVNKNESTVQAGKAPKAFYFKVVSRFDGSEVIGSLLLQETNDPSRYRVIKSGEVVYVEEPQNIQRSYNIVALLPGYKQNSVVFFYFNPPIETGPNKEEIITLTLEKAKSADFIEFSHVQFYENTYSLRSVSRNELDELSFLLKENPNSKIIIHGHSKVTANNLSLARAETVKTYLVKHGIEASRILTKGDEIDQSTIGGISMGKSDSVEVEFVKMS